MKAHGHDPIRREKGLLDAVAMVHVDVDVEDALVVLQELEDGEHNIINVAEPLGLLLLGVVQPSRKVDAQVATAVVEFDGGVDGAAARDLGKLEEAGEPGAVVLADIELVFVHFELPTTARLLPRHAASSTAAPATLQEIWSDSFEVLDVVLGVEDCHLLVGGAVGLLHKKIMKCQDR